MSLTVREQALAIFAARQALLAPVRVLGRHNPLDRAQAIVQAARRIMQLVEQLFVARRQRGSLLPLGDIVKDQPRQADKEHPDDQNGKKHVFHHYLFPLALSAAFIASSSLSTDSAAFRSAISSSRLFGPFIPSASARPSAKSARRSSTSNRLNASSVRLPFSSSRARARVTALSKRAAIAFWRARASRSLLWSLAMSPS